MTRQQPKLEGALAEARARKVAKGLSPATLSLFDERSPAVREFFGDCELRAITPKRIDEFQQARRDYGVSGRTINIELGVLRSVLISAGLWTDIRQAVEFEPENKDAARVLTRDEKERLLAVASSKPQWFAAYTAAVLAINTSCRSVEVRHLRWRDVDFAKRLLHIRITKGRTGGRRTIPLNDQCIAVLTELQKRAKAAGHAELADWLFPGRMLRSRPGSFRGSWRSLTKEAGLAGLRFHDLRHQFITELSEAGIPDPVIMSLVGHKTRQMLDTYTHVRIDAKKQAVEQLSGRGEPASPSYGVRAPQAAQKSQLNGAEIRRALIETRRGEQLAGAVRAVEVFGGAFLRIDLPSNGRNKGGTKYVRLESIDSITPLEPNEE